MTLAFLAAIAVLLAATPRATIDVDQDRVISALGYDTPLVEPHLSINPRDPNNLIAGAMLARPNHTYGVIGLSSRDGGQTWEHHDFGAIDGGDVWTAFLADGTGVLSFL